MKKLTYRLLAALLMASLLLSGCALAEGDPTEVVTQSTETLTLTKSAKKSVPIGAQRQIAVTGKTIKSCKSSAAKVATVTKDGLLTALKAGTAKITVTTTDKKKLTLTLTVTDPNAATKVTINQGKTATLVVGDTLQLTTTIAPATANKAVTWKSSKAAVASVDADGKVTAKKNGTAKITAKATGGKTAAITVTVSKYKIAQARYRYFRKYMSEKEFDKAYKAALEIVKPLEGMSRPDQLYNIARYLRWYYDTQMTYSMKSKHYNDPYGYLILKQASCAGCARTTGLCLNILGISYEHVNESKYSHQWCRVKVGSEYWICDAYGLYVGPEPAVRKHPRL